MICIGFIKQQQLAQKEIKYRCFSKQQQIFYIQMFPARNPINFIKNYNSLDNQACTICFKLSVDVYRCAGPCQKIFCIDCVDRFASSRYLCTFCDDSKTFSWNIVTKRSLVFECPYEPTHVQFEDLKEFKQHCYDCALMTPNDKNIRDKIVNYQCEQGHQLIFLSEGLAHKVFRGRGIFYALTNSQCRSCTEVTLCRSYCPQCSQNEKLQILYCVKCRLPPTSKTQCPLGHQLRQKNIRSMSAICDFCGYSDRFSTSYSYNDTECNFDICHRCYLQLNSDNKLIPLANQFVSFVEEPKKENPAKIIHSESDDS